MKQENVGKERDKEEEGGGENVERKRRGDS